MNAQRLSRIAAGIAIVTALGVAGLVTRNVLWPDDPDASLHSTGGKMLGDMAGYVGRVDREARTVDVSISPLGIRPVAMVVTNETAIVVNGKQGAIGDLWKDLPVRVYYEVRDNTRYATSIQVTSGDSLAASPAGKDPAASSPAAPSTAVAPPPVATTPTQATTPAPPAPVAATEPPAAPASTPTRPTLPPATVAAPQRPPASAPVASRPAPPPSTVATPVVPAAARVAEPAPAPSRAPMGTPATESASVGSSGAASPGAGRPAPAESEADGSAAIDWLLKGTGRR